MKLLNQEMLRAFRRECAGALGVNRDEAESMPSEALLTLFYAYYHYFNANPDYAPQLLDGGLLYDPNATHCITGIFKAPEADGAEPGTLDVLIALDGDVQTTPSGLGEQLANAYRGCIDYLQCLRGHPCGRMEKVEERLHNLGYEGFGNDHHPLRFRFLLPFIPTDKNRSSIESSLERKQKNVHEMLSMDDILFGDEIEYEVRNTNSACNGVHQGILLLDKSNNVCRYEGALIANITAVSLRKLYQTYRYRGLLSQNLRYFVKLARVDDAMLGTIFGAPENFWYLNNGIIIVCEDYELDGDRLELKSFSIINGGQTTHNIGELQEDALDGRLMVPCKVIKMKPGMKENERLDFIAEISEASNTQKPIKAIDAVANRREQRKLKQWLAAKKDCSIFYQAKRGETFDKRAFPEPWQKLESGVFAQTMLSFFYQYPGTARNRKAFLFSDDALYRQLFSGRFLPVEVVRDLNKLYLKTIDFAKSFKRPLTRDDRAGAIRRGLATNGIFQLIACVGVLSKMLYQVAHPNHADSSGPLLDDDHIGLASPAYRFLNPQDAQHGTELTKLLGFCLNTFILPGYEAYLSSKTGGNAYSNFMKMDGYYRNYILPKVREKITHGLSEEEWKLILAALRKPEEDEVREIQDFEAEHPIVWGPGLTSDKDTLIDDLVLKVESIPKARGVKKPTRSLLKKIVNRSLRSQRAFIGIGLTKEQCDVYAEAILGILKKADERSTNEANA